MSLLVDFHTHYFSRTFFETLAAASPHSGDVEARMARVCDTAGVELPGDDDSHLARWIAEMGQYGLDHVVSFASVPEEAPVLADLTERSGGRMVPFAVTDPTRDGAADRLDSLLRERGYRGALFFPAMHHFRIDGPEASEVLGVLAAHRGVAVVHCGMLQVRLRDLFGLPRRYDLTLANPLHVVPAADAHPDATFVVPHFGAGFFRETLMAGSQCPNVLVDTSSSNAWTSTQPRPMELADVFERALTIFGPRRILFGTDSSVFPRGWRRDLLLAQREAMGACGLGKRTSGRSWGATRRSSWDSRREVRCRGSRSRRSG